MLSLTFKIIILFCFLGVAMAKTEPNVETMKEDRVHIQNWNLFASRLVKLNNRLIKIHKPRVSESYGGYANQPDFYRELSYFYRHTGRLLSRVQWVHQRPELLHSIEIYIYDENGALLRDYQAAFLPKHRNAPIQTLINLHKQTSNTKAFRQFDASGNIIYESCQGDLNGQTISLDLWEDQLIQQGASTINKPGYQDCFQGIPRSSAVYQNPLIDAPNRLQGKLELSPLSYVTDVNREELQRYIRKLNKDIHRKTEKADLLTQRAVAYFLLHQFEDSINDYDRAISLNPRLAEAYFGRGMARGRAGQITEGIEDISTYLLMHPDSSLAYTKRGVRYLWRGDLQHAEQDMLKAIELNPDNAEAHDDLGVILAQRGETDSAIRHFSLTIRIDPSYQKAHHNLAMALYLEGKKPQALRAINSALVLSPDAQNSLLLKAEILEAMGERKAAAMIRNDAEFLPQGNWSEQFSVQ